MKEDRLSNKVSLDPYKLLVTKLGESVMSIFRQHEQGLDDEQTQMSNYKRLIGRVALNINALVIRNNMQNVEDSINESGNSSSALSFKK